MISLRSLKALNERIKINEISGCWEVQGYVDKDGYTQVSGKGAHRLAYELFVGSIPPGIYVCHRCDNPRCCNPDHLFLGTQKDNIADMMRKGRKADRHGEKNTQNKLTEQQVLEIYCATGGQHRIADQYGIDQSTVSNIKTGKLWGWLTKGVKSIESQKVLAI